MTPRGSDERVKANTVEIWEFDNSAGSFDHPMHLHVVQFQILERIGGETDCCPQNWGTKTIFWSNHGKR